MSQPVPRGGRILDVVSLVLVLVGAVCFVWAFLGMQEIRDASKGMTDEVYGYLARWERLSRLSWAGLGVIATGVSVGVGAAVYARRAGGADLKLP